MDKETSAIPTTVSDPKEKLAALREKRRLREAGIASTPITPRGEASTPTTPREVLSTPTTNSAADTATTTPTDDTIVSAADTAPNSINTVPVDEVPSKVARKSITIELEEDILELEPEKMVDAVVDAMNAISTNNTQIDSGFPSLSDSKIDNSLSSAELLSSNNSDMIRLQHLLFTTQCELKEKQSLLTESNSQLMTALNARENEKIEKETYSNELSTLKLSFGSLNKQLIDSKEIEKNLTALLSKAKEETNRDNESKPMPPPITATNNREVELEVQVNELMDTLEILTLDKEQLVMDNELLQVQMDDMTAAVEKGSGGGKGEALMTEENIKLREALRRLHLQSTSDKTLLDSLNFSNEKNEVEVKLLRDYKVKAEVTI